MPLAIPALDEPTVYPTDQHGLVRQCAWCRRVADASGAYRLAARALLDAASHGCCRDCAAALLRPQLQLLKRARAA
jgi:hypothetical protein